MARLAEAQEHTLIAATLVRGATFVLLDAVKLTAAGHDAAAGIKPVASFVRNKPQVVPAVVAEYLSNLFDTVDVEVEPGIFERRSLRKFRFEPPLPNMPEAPAPVTFDRRTPDQRRLAAEYAEAAEQQ